MQVTLLLTHWSYVFLAPTYGNLVTCHQNHNVNDKSEFQPQLVISSYNTDSARKDFIKHQISNIRHTKSPNLDVSRLILQLFLPKPGVKSRMKMQLEQCRQMLLQLHLSDQRFYCLLRYILYERFDGTESDQCQGTMLTHLPPGDLTEIFDE